MEMEVLPNALLEAVSLLDGERVCLCDDRHDVHTPMKVLHELHIDWTETGEEERRGGGRERGREGGREGINTQTSHEATPTWPRPLTYARWVG